MKSLPAKTNEAVATDDRGLEQLKPSGAQTTTKTSLKQLITSVIDIRLVLIPDGQFSRESSTVKITHPFYIGECEVTQAQWQKVMGSNPSKFPHDALAPVNPLRRGSILAVFRWSGLPGSM